MSNSFWPHGHGICQARILKWIAISFAKMLIRSNQIIVLFRSFISLLIFCLLGLSISDRGVLRSSVIKGNFSISPFSFISFCLMYFDLFDSLKKKNFQYYFLWFLDPCQKLQFGIYILKHDKAQLLCFGNIGLRWICLLSIVLGHAKSLHVSSSATSWMVACQVPLSLGFSRTLEWVVIPSSKGSSQPKDEPSCLALQVDSLALSPIYRAEYGIWKVICRNNLKS